MITREEHLKQCKKTAIEYIKNGDLGNAYSSFYSDMLKHPETAEHIALELGMQLLLGGHLSSPRQMEEFILGFN